MPGANSAAAIRGRSTDVADPDHGLVIPEGGFWPAPEIGQPNIYPMEWRVETEKPAEIYQKSKRTAWNPAHPPGDALRAAGFTPGEGPGVTYWVSVLGH